MSGEAQADLGGWRMMVRGRTSLVCALAVLPLLAGVSAAAGPRLTARAAIVMDARTGETLFARNADQPLPPASTTKVMTAILALESGRLREYFPVSKGAAATYPSKIYFRVGERMRLDNLVYALLLKSANDAAEVVAEGLGGSRAKFAARMNAKARKLGARHAHFVNPHGLTAPGHVASARDLAVIFRYGMDVPGFREALATRRRNVQIRSSRVRTVALASHNRLLYESSYPVIGKTGFTRAARRCFVGAATNGGREIVIALLGATDMWGDARRLLAYGFDRAGEQPQVVMARATAPAPAAPEAKRPEPEVAEGDLADEEEPPRPASWARFAVQLGPYGSKETAAKTQQRLERVGYAAVVSGRALRLGEFSSRSRAQRLASVLRRTGYAPTIVSVR